MPLYEYRCRECGHRFEILQRLGEGGEGLGCPRCGVEAPEKQFSTFATASAGTASAGDAEMCGSADCGMGACCGAGGCADGTFN